MLHIKNTLSDYKRNPRSKIENGVQKFEKNQLIESNYKIISNGKLYSVDKLTSKNISEGFVVYKRLDLY